MREYDPKILRKLQLKELEILKDFDALCRKHDIPYFIFYGAGIGAIRHGGFVPWDDDIDLLMLRQDYNQFLEIAKTEASDKYCLINAEADPNFPAMVTCFGLKGTRLITDDFKTTGGEGLICIDLHPLDNISDDSTEAKTQSGAAWFWHKLMILRQMSHPPLHFGGLKEKIIYFMCGVIHIGLKALHISPKWLYKNCRKACLQFNDRKTERVAYLTSTIPGETRFARTELFPPQYLEFEGIMLPFPRELEKLLSRTYGDYMQLPPEDKRRNHFPDLLDFGDGEVHAAKKKL